MRRLPVAILIAAAGFAVIAGASAELPMSPVFRTGLPGKSGKPAEFPVSPQSQPAQGGASTAEKPHGAPGTDPEIVATAPIPPPPAAPPEEPARNAAVEPVAAPPPAPAEQPKRHVARKRRVARSYQVLYRSAPTWGTAWAARGADHLGPNPYSPNGGD